MTEKQYRERERKAYQDWVWQCKAIDHWMQNWEGPFRPRSMLIIDSWMRATVPGHIERQQEEAKKGILTLL